MLIAKIFLILYPPLENSTFRIAIKNRFKSVQKQQQNTNHKKHSCSRKHMRRSVPEEEPTDETYCRYRD